MRRGLRPAFRTLALTAALALSACSTIGLGGSDGGASSRPATADVIGTGKVRVALLLPRSAVGNGAATATAFRNAAELALRDFPAAGIQIAVYDTHGTPEQAQVAVGTALREGAEIILGPVFSGEVAAVAPQARAAGVPIVAFSSDASVAGPGVYLLSFLPSDDVGRIVSYAARQGRKSFAALLPATSYGAVVEASFRRAVAAAGGRIVAIESYQADAASINAQVAAVARIAPQIDALFMPDSGETLLQLAAALQVGGVTRDKVKFLGSGQWDDPRILNNGAMVGSWFPAPAKQGFEGFARRYQAAYGAVPPRNATLAYDATVLAVGLVRQFGAARFENSVLTGANGFTGLDGAFRFQSNGLTERRLAVYEITGSGALAIDPAARTFAGGT